MRYQTQINEQNEKLKLFISYCHKDEEYKEYLDTNLIMLKRSGLIDCWHDRKILPGEEWKSEIHTELDTSHIILLLISTDFLSSRYCWDIEMKKALDMHDAGIAKVVPIILRPVSGLEYSPFSKLQYLPKDGEPVSNFSDRDKAYKDIVDGLFKVVQNWALSSPETIDYLWKLDLEKVEPDDQTYRDILIALREQSNDINIIQENVELDKKQVRIMYKSSKETLDKIQSLFESGILLKGTSVQISDLSRVLGAKISVKTKNNSAFRNKDIKFAPTVVNNVPPLVMAIRFQQGKDRKLNLGFELGTEGETYYSEEKKVELQELLGRYFTAFLVAPQNDLFVNLSPVNKDTCLADSLRGTEAGRLLLEQDLQLKKTTCELLYPDSEIGARYWQKINKLGLENPLEETCIRVWITTGSKNEVKPEEIDGGVRVSLKKIDLKVLSACEGQENFTRTSIQKKADKIFEEIILPEITNRVTSGPEFGKLRQLYTTWIFAGYFTKYLFKTTPSFLVGKDVSDMGLKVLSENDYSVWDEYVQLFEDGVWSEEQMQYDPKSKRVKKKVIVVGGFVFE